MTIIVSGPMGCGKTHNRDAIARYFDCTRIIDGWEPGSAQKIPRTGPTLVLTSANPEKCRRSAPFAPVLRFADLTFLRAGASR